MDTIRALATLGIALLLGTANASAQDLKADTSAARISDTEISLLRKDLRDQKKQVVAANLPLTGDEAAKFWPEYDAYTQETIKLNDRRYALFKEYAANYHTMTDAQASSYIRRWNQVDGDFTNLRLEWIPKF